MTSTNVARKPRVIGVDVARGLALVGMFATHVFGTLGDNGDPTLAHVVAGGRAATTFVVVAGVSLAFLSGGRRCPHGRELAGVSAGLAVRALLVGAIGLALGYLSDASGVLGILPFYGLLFLLAIPLVSAAPMVLIGIAAATFALGPVLLVATADAGLPGLGTDADPTFGTLVQDPVGLLAQLFLTGEYPVVVYLGYLCVGLAIGRLDLRSPRVAWLLLGGGAALAIVSRVVSAVLLYPLGGLARLIEQDVPGAAPSDIQALLWDPDQSSSWWYLALPAPHSHTPIDLLHTLGCALVVLGSMLLLTRIAAVARALAPLAAAGAMSLTVYSAHLVLLATGVLEDQPALLFALMVAGMLALAWAWRWRFGQGPLEAVVAKLATATRRGVTRRLPPSRPDGTPPSRGRVYRTARGGAQLLVPLVCAGVLALSFWGGAQLVVSQDAGTADVTDTAVADPAGPAEEAADDEVPDAAAQGPAPSPVPAAGPADAGTSPVDPGAVDPGAVDPGAVDPAGDIARYCEVSDQLYALEDANPDQPGVVAEQGAPQLDEMPQVAPAQIRDAVVVVVDDYRAEAGVPGVLVPDDATLTQAEATVEAFEVENC